MIDREREAAGTSSTERERTPEGLSCLGHGSGDFSASKSSEKKKLAEVTSMLMKVSSQPA